jgi:hypothetical protein
VWRAVFDTTHKHKFKLDSFVLSASIYKSFSNGGPVRDEGIAPGDAQDGDGIPTALAEIHGTHSGDDLLR